MARRILALAGLIIGGSFIWQVFFKDHHHAHYWFHFVPGFDVVLGLSSTFVLIWTAKTLGEFVLQRPESYYAGPEDGSTEPPDGEDMDDGDEAEVTGAGDGLC